MNIHVIILGMNCGGEECSTALLVRSNNDGKSKVQEKDVGWHLKHGVENELSLDLTKVIKMFFILPGFKQGNYE